MTKFDCEPVSHLDAALAKAAEDKYFTKLDMGKGYWQIPMEEANKPLTAFTSSQGSFHFTKMSYGGGVNSAATLNRVMRKVLHNADHVDLYMGDVLGHTVRWHKHLTLLRDLFTRLREARLTMRPTKTKIGYKEVDFIGHVIGAGKVAMDPEKLGKIQEAPRPQTKRRVRAFLGLVGYYRRFIPNSAERAVPLTDLTKKGQPNLVRWGE